MLNELRFLESMGSQPGFMSANEIELDAMLDKHCVSDAFRNAMIANDRNELTRLLDGRQSMYCLVRMPGEDDEKSPEDLPQREDEQEEESEE